jgi:glycosyltransferase involved in cell wall biosynthesis
MRIAMVCDRDGPPTGGAGETSGPPDRHVVRLAAGLVRQGHRVAVYTRDGHPPRPLADGLDVVGVPAGPADGLDGSDGEPPRYLGRFGDGLAERWGPEPPDVVHAHGWTAGLAAVLAATVAGVPVVQAYHGLTAAGRPHGGAGEGSGKSRARWERMVGQRAQHVVASCTDEVGALLRMGVPRTRIAVVPAGVDLTRFNPDGPAARRQSGHRLVVVGGSLAPATGMDTVVSALRGLTDTELLVVGGPPDGRLGDHPHARRLMARAGAAGVAGQVRLLGPVPVERLPAVLRSADAAVCVPWCDPWGTAALEAMACGLPVVAAPVGALADTVVDGVTGVYVPPRRPDLLARAVRRLLADGGMRFAFGVAGRDRAQARYSWDRIATDVASVYRWVARRADEGAPARSVGSLAGLRVRRGAHPDRRAGLRGPHLDEVAQLVDHPQAPAVGLVQRRTPPPGQRVLDVSPVPDLADQRVALLPEQDHTPPAAVPDAVGG